MVMQNIRKLLLAVSLFLVLHVSVTAQDQIFGPATGSLDSKSIFANPALISFQNSHFSLGVKSYYMGFFDNSQFDYNQGFFNISTPRMIGTRIGSGVHVQYFNSPIFSRTQVGGSVSVQILRRFAIGANASLYHIGYNSDNFIDFDFGDPVFQDGFSRVAFNTGVGLYARPIADLEIGLGARNLNEPDLSMIGDNANEPMELFAAISYKYGLLRGTFEMVQGRYGLQNRSHIELYSTQGYYARFGTNLNFSSGYIEAQARAFGGFSVNYQYELPFNELAGNTSGSHMVSLIYEFNRIPPLPDRRHPAVPFPTIQRERSAPEIPSAIVLNSDTDHMRFYEINLTRIVDETTVTIEDLASLSAYDIGKLEEKPELERTPYEESVPALAPIPETIELTSPISSQYQNTLELIKNYLNDDALENVRILINEGGELRAAGIRNELREQVDWPVSVANIFLPSVEDSSLYDTPVDWNMLQDEQVIRLDPEIAVIRPIITFPLNIRNWVLNFYDHEGSLINQINGTGTVPEVIEWDWIANNGRRIEPGLYTYRIEWVTENGAQGASRTRNLYVQKIERNIRIDITKDIERILDDPDRIDVILKNN